MAERAIDRIEGKNETGQRNRLVYWRKTKPVNLCSHGIQFARVMNLPWFLQTVCLNRRSSVRQSTILFCEPPINWRHGVQMPDQFLILSPLFGVLQVTGAEHLRPYRHVVGNDAVPRLCKGL